MPDNVLRRPDGSAVHGSPHLMGPTATPRGAYVTQGKFQEFAQAVQMMGDSWNQSLEQVDGAMRGFAALLNEARADLGNFMLDLMTMQRLLVGLGISQERYEAVRAEILAEMQTAAAGQQKDAALTAVAEQVMAEKGEGDDGVAGRPHDGTGEAG